MRGPALKGENIIGLEVKVDSRSSSQRSGSNTSASGPHRAGLRCVRTGKYMTGVHGGMYMGSSGSGNVPSDFGMTDACGLDSRPFVGTGGKRRSVSLITARTGV